ncbi:hypothetical protein [Evansella clarkii]|uniref:hypothetical protein n=1 Tax=Evansella clarkii TaxID=79879 RepID=UPI000B43A0A8|nr:hypothetical protein [Evansella clarkii]
MKLLMLLFLIAVLATGCGNNEAADAGNSTEELPEVTYDVNEDLIEDGTKLLAILDGAYFENKALTNDDEEYIEYFIETHYGESGAHIEDATSTEKILVRSLRRMTDLKEGDSEPMEYEYERPLVAQYLGVE